MLNSLKKHCPDKTKKIIEFLIHNKEIGLNSINPCIELMVDNLAELFLPEGSHNLVGKQKEFEVNV